MTSEVALDDLAFFADGSVDLHTSNPNGLVVCTSVLSVSPTWLIGLLCSRYAAAGRSVVLVTFTSKVQVYTDILKRYRLDISTDPKSNLSILDLSGEIFCTTTKDDGHTSDFSSASISALLTLVQSHVSPGAAVILESPDMLVASGVYEWSEVSKLLLQVQKLSGETVVFCNADEPTTLSQYPIAHQQAQLLTTTIHRASVVLALRPLPTGRARDMTGVLTISNGPYPAGRKVSPIEYTYEVTRKHVKLFHR